MDATHVVSKTCCTAIRSLIKVTCWSENKN